MRTVLLALGMVLAGGCSFGTTDMLNNDFGAAIPTKPPSEFVGVWTGSSGPYLFTVALNSDGTGKSCSVWNDKKVVGRLKYSSGSLLFQDGTRMSVRRVGNDLVGRSPYSGSRDVRFRHDPELSSADPYCLTRI